MHIIAATVLSPVLTPKRQEELRYSDGSLYRALRGPYFKEFATVPYTPVTGDQFERRVV